MNKVLFGHLGTLLGAAFCAFCALVSASAQTNMSTATIANTNRLAITNLPPAPRRPPIVLIIADNIGYGELGGYGQSKIKTPNLDKLASQGIRFTSFYAGSPQDELSRASLLTGLEPRHIGGSESHPLPMDAVTVAAVLKESGYHTGLIGEWNLGDTPPVQPNVKGFDEFAGFLSAGHARNYFADNIYRQDTASGSNRVETLPANWNGARKLYLPDFLGTMGANFVKNNHPNAQNHFQGLFLCVSYPVPHAGELPQDATYASENWPQAQKDRATMITRMDQSIGALLDQLVKYKMDTNAVVIFTSIGGAQKEGEMDPKFFNGNGSLRGQAGSVYEGGIRVPMIIRWPARIKPGQVSDAPWATWDLLPTLADIAMMKLPKKTDGISMMPVLVGKGKVAEHEAFYWETRENDLQQAARMGDWKVVRMGTNSPALYNLKDDISEKEDVAAKNADAAKKMKKILGSPLK